LGTAHRIRVATEDLQSQAFRGGSTSACTAEWWGSIGGAFHVQASNAPTCESTGASFGVEEDAAAAPAARGAAFSGAGTCVCGRNGILHEGGNMERLTPGLAGFHGS